MYADVIVNNDSAKTEGPFTYRIPEGMTARAGDRVDVTFSLHNRKIKGYVVRTFDALEKPIRGLKDILAVDPDVSFTEEMLRTAEWMERRYYCRPIEALNLFAPAGAPSKRGKTRSPYRNVPERDEPKPLTDEQAAAMRAIVPALDAKRHETVLIHGVTGSGKTELYLQVIERVIENGRKAILLVPEISLTPQTVNRFLRRFGPGTVAVLHSKLSSGQRYDEWMRAKRGEVSVIVGARSAVFAPFDDIGVIILDEEHESSYRSDQTPKYDALEVAEARAEYHGATVLLGSATPDIGSTREAEEGRWKRVTLERRYNKTPLPLVTVADMREELKAGNRTIFSRQLHDAMRDSLARDKQIILFLNRRGYEGFLSCRTCGYVMKCPDCGIALTTHRNPDRAVCHYCGRSFPLIKTCPECGSTAIRSFGIGTEKVEEEVRKLFPDAPVSRLDLDTASRKGATEEILSEFGAGKTKILIGTQLVAKGLDFADVGLVGIVAADITLNIPDFRAAERTFQLITQAAGRAGRGTEQGTVVIQTYSPDHYAIRTAAAHDYRSFYAQEILIREALRYPPFADMIQMVVSCEKDEDAAEAADKIRAWLTKKLPADLRKNILGPRKARLVRADGRYRYQLLLKIRPEDAGTVDPILRTLKTKIARETEGRWVFRLDVNPYSFS